MATQRKAAIPVSGGRCEMGNHLSNLAAQPTPAKLPLAAGCHCQREGRVRPECQHGIFPPFETLECEFDLEKLLTGLDKEPHHHNGYKRHLCRDCGVEIKKQSDRCRSCATIERWKQTGPRGFGKRS